MLLLTVLILFSVPSLFSLLAILVILQQAKKRTLLSSRNTSTVPPSIRFAMIPTLILIILLPVAAFIMPQYLLVIIVVATALLATFWIWFLPLRSDPHYVEQRRDARQKRVIIGEAKIPRDDSDQPLHHFLPPQLLTLMKKSNSSEIREGDSIHLKLSVLVFSPFSLLVSGGPFSPAKRFEAINENILFYDNLFNLNHTLYSSFSGNYAMALFDPNTIHPIKAAILINKKSRIRLDSLNNNSITAVALTNRPHYCAITQGTVTIGFVNYNNMLQPIVFSSTISNALQLQQVAQKLRVPILASQDFIDESPAREKFHIRTVGPLHEQSNRQVIRTYEILNGYPLHRIEKLVQNRKIFEEACSAREGGDANAAYSKFSYVLANDPLDTLAQYFLDMTRQRLPAHL